MRELPATIVIVLLAGGALPANAVRGPGLQEGAAPKIGVVQAFQQKLGFRSGKQERRVEPQPGHIDRQVRTKLHPSTKRDVFLGVEVTDRYRLKSGAMGTHTVLISRKGAVLKTRHAVVREDGTAAAFGSGANGRWKLRHAKVGDVIVKEHRREPAETRP